MQQAFRQKHHTLSTLGGHTLRVATMSLSICYALRKFHISTDIPAVVTGSLCHDLGMLGRGEKYSSVMECSRQHPVDSLEIARKLMGEVPEKTTDIISRHMWPLSPNKPPNSLEAVIVSSADKIASVKDFIEGYERKRPGIRGVVRELVNWQKEWALWKKKE
ncbi:MAG: HD domain-containing protein [Stomatobaculum sp.]|nr:HD domain-containing protein [Stomatobaculum sp.]